MKRLAPTLFLATLIIALLLSSNSLAQACSNKCADLSCGSQICLGGRRCVSDGSGGCTCQSDDICCKLEWSTTGSADKDGEYIHGNYGNPVIDNDGTVWFRIANVSCTPEGGAKEAAKDCRVSWGDEGGSRTWENWPAPDIGAQPLYRSHKYNNEGLYYFEYTCNCGCQDHDLTAVVVIKIVYGNATTTTTTSPTSTTAGPGPTTTTTSIPIPPTPYDDIVKRINDVVCLILNLLFYITGAIFAMMLIIAGFKYLTSDDPSTVHNAKMMTVYALIGFILVVIACPLVDYLIAGSDIVPFTKSCNCLLGSGGGSTPTTTTTVPVKCVDGTPHGQCSTTTAYRGYRCVGSYTAPFLQFDTSCSGGSTTSSVSTTTPVSTTTSSSTTTTMCGSKKLCWIAETGAAGNTCGGLILTCGAGTMENCCTNYNCCCSPAIGCTYP